VSEVAELIVVHDAAAEAAPPVRAEVVAAGALHGVCFVRVKARRCASELQEPWVYFAAGLGGKVNAPFSGYCGQGFGADVCGHRSEEDVHRQSWVVAY